MCRRQVTTQARIGFDATAAFTQGGGIGRYTRELLDAVLRLESHYRFQIFTGRLSHDLKIAGKPGGVADTGIRHLPLSPRWLYRLWYRLRLPIPVQLFTGTIALFHSPDFVLPPVWGRIPTLLTVHDLSFEYYPETFTDSLVRYLKRVVPWSVGRASHILADSRWTKRDLISLYQTPAEKITVLYSGVNERFCPVRDQTDLALVRQKYHLGDEPYIFTVSTLQPRKNHMMLIRAFASVAAEIGHSLVIAGGKGWLYEEMMAEIERLGLINRVRFTGFVEDEDLPALYSGASCFVFPSLYEGFGLPILEAMACGTPVIASNASSLPEVSGEAALQLSPFDGDAWAGELLSLVKDEHRQRRLSEAGLARARRFSWRNAARQLLEVYDQLLSAEGP